MSKRVLATHGRSMAAHHFDDSRPHEGLHEIIGDREIDPSLPPVDYCDLAESSDGRTWRPSPINPDLATSPDRLSPVPGDNARFIADRHNEPTLDRTMIAADSH